MEYTVKYQRFNAKGQIESAEKTFWNPVAMERHIDWLEKWGNLYQVLGYYYQETDFLAEL